MTFSNYYYCNTMYGESGGRRDDDERRLKDELQEAQCLPDSPGPHIAGAWLSTDSEPTPVTLTLVLVRGYYQCFPDITWHLLTRSLDLNSSYLKPCDPETSFILSVKTENEPYEVYTDGGGRQQWWHVIVLYWPLLLYKCIAHWS